MAQLCDSVCELWEVDDETEWNDTWNKDFIDK